MPAVEAMSRNERKTVLSARLERNDEEIVRMVAGNKKKDLAATYSPARMQYHRRESA